MKFVRLSIGSWNDVYSNYIILKWVTVYKNVKHTKHYLTAKSSLN